MRKSTGFYLTESNLENLKNEQVNLPYSVSLSSIVNHILANYFSNKEG